MGWEEHVVWGELEWIDSRFALLYSYQNIQSFMVLKYLSILFRKYWLILRNLTTFSVIWHLSIIKKTSVLVYNYIVHIRCIYVIRFVWSLNNKITIIKKNIMLQIDKLSSMLDKFLSILNKLLPILDVSLTAR